MAAATSSHGAQLKLGDAASPEVFTTIAGVRDIAGLSYGNDTTEVTAHDSGSRWRQFIDTLRKESNITFELVFDSTDATHDETTGLLAKAEAGGLHNFQLILTDTGDMQAAFAAVVSDLTWKAPVEGFNAADLSLQVSGAITIT